MPALFEALFAAALLDAKRPIPQGITAPNAAVPTRRFAVHRNNVVAGLVKALQTRFPAVQKIVGEEFFAAMARAFVVEQPPCTPLLATYGDEFAAFIAAFEPACELTYLADVARLEAARTRAYHAADATPLTADQFAALDPYAVGSMRFDLHPSTEIVRSPHPIVTIWAMNSGEAGCCTCRELARRGCARVPPVSRRGSPRAGAGWCSIPARAGRRSAAWRGDRGRACRRSGIRSRPQFGSAHRLRPRAGHRPSR